jgi:hypothetical protein
VLTTLPAAACGPGTSRVVYPERCEGAHVAVKSFASLRITEWRSTETEKVEGRAERPSIRSQISLHLGEFPSDLKLFHELDVLTNSQVLNFVK